MKWNIFIKGWNQGRGTWIISFNLKQWYWVDKRFGKVVIKRINPSDQIRTNCNNSYKISIIIATLSSISSIQLELWREQGVYQYPYNFWLRGASHFFVIAFDSPCDSTSFPCTHSWFGLKMTKLWRKWMSGIFAKIPVYLLNGQW